MFRPKSCCFRKLVLLVFYNCYCLSNLLILSCVFNFVYTAGNSNSSGRGRNRIGRREKWPKQSWEEGEIGGKSTEEGEKEKLTFREEGQIGSKSREDGEIGSESREKGDLTPCSTPLFRTWTIDDNRYQLID